MMRILYVGDLWHGSTALHRMIALQELGHKVVGIDTTPPVSNTDRRLITRILRRCGYPPDLAKANRQIISLNESDCFDILWVDKGLTISPTTLLTVRKYRPACRIMSYSPDDMLNPRNQSHRYLDSVPIYDLHVTTKTHNISELKMLGARDVFFVAKGFDPNVHKPMQLSVDEQRSWGADVGFIGDFEQNRYRLMLAVADSGIDVVVRGPRWDRYVNSHPHLLVKPGWIVGKEYAKAISATKINLGFLRKANRDRSTTRSIEIPACGAFLLAERTDEHLDLYTEGTEAEFFEGKNELIAKITYYLHHEAERTRIAAAGRTRCLVSGYSNHDQLKTVLDYLASKM